MRSDPVPIDVRSVPNSPLETLLGQNYPDPFNGISHIGFRLSRAGPVKLGVYDLLGREVATLVDGTLSAGDHEVRIEGAGLSSGVYLYRLQTGDFVQSKRLLLLK